MNKIRWRERALQPVLSGTRRPRLTNRRARSTDRLQHEHVRSSPNMFPKFPMPLFRRYKAENHRYLEIDSTVSWVIPKNRFAVNKKIWNGFYYGRYHFRRGNKTATFLLFHGISACSKNCNKIFAGLLKSYFNKFQVRRRCLSLRLDRWIT